MLGDGTVRCFIFFKFTVNAINNIILARLVMRQIGIISCIAYIAIQPYSRYDSTAPLHYYSAEVF